MEAYDFDRITDRRNTFSYKWDIKEGELPMWVADMDFETAPCVKEALIRRAEHGIFGYSVVPQEWNRAICGWWQRRHHFQMQEDWLIFCTGVIPAIDVAVKRMTNVGDNVVVQTPVYNIFYNCVENHGRHVLENRLLYEKGQYEMDFLQAFASDQAWYNIFHPQPALFHIYFSLFLTFCFSHSLSHLPFFTIP
jgi:cystathionine beta-lyase